MNILITGGTGFIGKQLCRHLADNNQLTVLSRKPASVKIICGSTVSAISHLSEISTQTHFDAIINLAGENIVEKRWTKQRKKILIASRIDTTQQLVQWIQAVDQKPEVLISGSAIGFYGNQTNKELDESSEPVSDFAQHLCSYWEETAKQAVSTGTRVCIIRTGLVLGRHGGFLKRMLPTFKLGLGGRLGDGAQWMSWIHINDYIRIVELLLHKRELHGIFNATAPKPVSNIQFTQSLAKQLNRPALLPVPAIVLRILLGEMSELLLGSQRVLPLKLQQTDFIFEFNCLDGALQDVLN